MVFMWIAYAYLVVWCFFGNKDTDISLLGYYVGHIDVSIALNNCVVSNFTGSYRNPRLRHLHTLYKLPWVFASDFNGSFQ